MRALGLDIGTTNLSAVVFNADCGCVERAVCVANDARVHAEPWAHLQDPDVIWDKIHGLCKELFGAYPDIACVGLTGQMHGIVYVDNAGRAVSPLITWQDGRGDLPYDGEMSYAEALSRQSGYELSTGYGSVTHGYNLRNGLVPPRARAIVCIHDYIGMRLTDQSKPLLHASNAASLGAFDLASGAFGGAALLRSGIDPALFPSVTGETVVIGVTAADGCPRGIPVAISIGDNQASFIGSVKRPFESVLVNMGTGGQICIATKNAPPTVKDLEVRPYLAGQILLVGFSLCGGRSYQLLEQFFRAVCAMAGAGDKPLYDSMSRLLDDSGELVNPLCVSTLFDGQRGRPKERGSITNLGSDNFTPAHLISGVLSGMANELYVLYEKMSVHRNARELTLIGSGNALRRNPHLRRAFENAFGASMVMPMIEEEAAVGACLFALAASGLCSSVEEAQGAIRYEQRE